MKVFLLYFYCIWSGLFSIISLSMVGIITYGLQTFYIIIYSERTVIVGS